MSKYDYSLEGEVTMTRKAAVALQLNKFWESGCSHDEDEALCIKDVCDLFNVKHHKDIAHIQFKIWTDDYDYISLALAQFKQFKDIPDIDTLYMADNDECDRGVFFLSYRGLMIYKSFIEPPIPQDFIDEVNLQSPYDTLEQLSNTTVSI